MSNLKKINIDHLTAFLNHLENKKKSETYEKCLLVLKTLLSSSSNFTYNTTLNTESNIRTLLNSINFDVIEHNHIIKLKSILDQGADIDIYTRYIKSILNKNDKALNSILMEIWIELGSNVLKLPVFIHEKSIEVYPAIFEKTILSALLLSKFKDLIDLCSKSPIIFQTCSSIINELLIKFNFTDKFMRVLIHFVKNVHLQYKKNSIDITDIYPIKYRNILILKDIKNNNSILVTKYYLNEEFKKIASNPPKELICLLSHFPDLYLPI